MFVVALAMSVVACGGGDPAGTGADPSESPRITESESGRVVGEPATVEDLLVTVSADGVVTFVVSGTVPSPCHGAVAGFEEPNPDGLLVGSAESWLDLDCVVTDEPTPFRLAVPIQGLADGHYTVRLRGTNDRSFAIPNVGRVDGPVLVSPLPDSDELEGMAAEVKGTVLYDDATGCLLLDLEDARYPLVWPGGTSWRTDPPGVILDSGEIVEPGMTVHGGGGYLQREGIEHMAGTAVADAAARCAGPTGEIAIFNIGSTVTITSG
jgi:hypothetical protein